MTFKEERHKIVEATLDALERKYGREYVRRDGDRYLRVKIPQETGGPLYVRIDFRMER